MYNKKDLIYMDILFGIADCHYEYRRWMTGDNAARRPDYIRAAGLPDYTDYILQRPRAISRMARSASGTWVLLEAKQRTKGSPA